MNLLGSFDRFVAICDNAGIIISLFIYLHLSCSVFHAMFVRNDSNDKHFYYKYFYNKYRFIRIMKQNINCNEH